MLYACYEHVHEFVSDQLRITRKTYSFPIAIFQQHMFV